MVARPDHLERIPRASLERAGEALEALAEAGAGIAAARGRVEAMRWIAEGLAQAAGAEITVLRILDADGQRLTACAVASTSSAVAAELEGSRFAIDELSLDEVTDLELLPSAVRLAATRTRAASALQLPILVGDQIVGSVELLRAGRPFDGAERRAARVAAAQAALAIRAFPDDREHGRLDLLALAGDALAAGGEHARTAEQIPRVAAEATQAAAGLLWRLADERLPTLIASHGLESPGRALVDAAEVAARALRTLEPVIVENVEGELLPAGAGVSATLRLGQPPVGALQLLFPPGSAPSEEDLGRLATFGVRAAHALRTSVHVQTVAAELERTRALLTVVGQATAQLSLAHTLETAVARVAELLGVERLAVYLRDEGRLYAAAGTGLAGPHVRLAARLLELALGPFRSRGMLSIGDVGADPRLAAVGDAAAETGIETAIAMPLAVREQAIGLLAVFPERGRVLTENESALLSALAAQLAVAVQNAQLHEQTKQLGEERERALDSERAAARQLGALYEISRSFAQSLSLDATLDAVARTVAEVLDVDVATIGLPDERRESLIPRALQVRESRLEDVVRTIVSRPWAFGTQPLQRLFRLGDSLPITREALEQIGEPATALTTFLERGWTGAIVPIATPAEVLASLTIISIRPGAPITEETIRQASAIARQAALAIDNARLYQQQKEFADTMQRSLLPRSVPELQGLEVGDAYQSSARVEVGGDVYDFVALDDGRLAVVLGDVTGHGIEAAADMAMAKFVFRSLVREHPNPGEFLQFANDVVVGEIAPGKFITMVYLVVDGQNGTVACAGAGHPPPRTVDPDGMVRPLDVHGLVLGVEAGQEYDEVRAPLAPGSSVVLYTDGVIEARHEGELYGLGRLDAIVSAGRELSAQDLAETVLADCRDFADNELVDDCAVVVIKRVS
jgi:serine phosphatase RsbU (regulator of sigma subunit)